VGLADRRRRQRLPVEPSEHFVHRSQLRLDDRSDAVGRLARGAVLQRGQLVADAGRQQVDAGGRDLPELHVHPAGLLQHPAQSDADRLGLPLGLAARPEQRPEPLCPDQPQQLAIAADDVDPAADGSQRPGRHHQPGLPRPSQRAGCRQQVEADRRGHRGRHGDDQHLEHQPVRTPVAVVQGECQQPADEPARHASRQRRRPAPADAEEPQRQPRRHDREQRGDDHPACDLAC
jgi:hypothetical protein